MSASLDLFRVLFPEFSGEADARVETHIEIASLRLTPSTWGQVYGQAVVYLAAHLISLSPTPGGGGGFGGAPVAGPVTSMSTGGVSVSFGASSSAPSGGSSGSDASLSTTPYGREFVALRASRAARAPFVARGT